MTPQAPRAILFDWDNTLVDNWGVIAEAMNAVFAAFDMPPWTLAETKARTRASLRDGFPRLFGERAKEAGRIFSDYFAARHLESLRGNAGGGRASGGPGTRAASISASSATSAAGSCAWRPIGWAGPGISPS